MALQGDLQSFALPDVLRLLAGTGKSGRLEVAGPGGGGELILQGGTITAGAVERAPHATAPGDIVFEILRFDGGAFTFVELDGEAAADGTDVDAAIAHAEHLVAEWADVETVVPSMHAWVSLAPELSTDAVEVTAGAWRTLVAVGSGGTVRDLADATEQTDLAACRQVKAMVEQGLLAVRPDHTYSEPLAETYVGPTVELDSFEEFEVSAADPMAELEELGAEDRPVVMEDREDALLPEPLPGEGVAFEGALIEGTVDGRAFEPDAAVEAGTDEVAEVPDPIDPIAELTAEPMPEALADPMPEVVEDPAAAEFAAAMGDEIDQVGDAAPFAEVAAEGVGFDDETSPEADDERGSLLRFLSTVKP